MDEEPVQTTHAETDFDPKDYFTLYDTFTGSREDDTFVKFKLDSLHDFYNEDGVSGDSLLDIGTGPVVHTVFPAYSRFQNIVLSDYAETNLEVLRNWKAGGVQHEEPVFRYMLEQQGLKDDWLDCYKRLADKVKVIVRCDIQKENPLSGTEAEHMKFDVISLILVQVVASLDHASYKKAVLNYSRLLKPGGHIIVMDVLGESWYQVGKYRYPCLPSQREELQDIYRSCGYEILSWKQNDDVYDPTSNLTGIYAMLAKLTV